MIETGYNTNNLLVSLNFVTIIILAMRLNKKTHSPIPNNMKKEKSSFKYFLFLLVVSAMMVSCGGSNKDTYPNATITVNDDGGKEAGLDLQALGELVKKSSNPADLEKSLNTAGSINNLDLDSDGKVDFIKVTELSKDANSKGLKFTDIESNGDSSEIATINITKGANNQASMDVAGSPAVYQDPPTYHSDFSVGEVLLLAYLFSPHPYYYSPYHYGYYPGYYHYYRPVSTVVYHRTVTTYNSHPVGTVTHTGGSTSSNRSSLSSSGRSQKSFSTRSSSSPVGSGGFGSKSSSSSSSGSYHPSSSGSHSSSYHSSSSSSRRSFGGGRRR